MGFRAYFFKRLFDSIVTWIFVLILNFFFLYLPTTGGSFKTFAGQLPEYLKFIFVQRFGAQEPFGSHVLDFVFNYSIHSLILLLLALAISIPLGIFLGTLASYKQGGKIDAALTIAVIVPSTFPAWWLAAILRAYLYPPFPGFGWYSDRWLFQSPLSDLLGFIPEFLSYLLLPLLTFVLTLTGIFFIVTRNSLRNVYAEDYITMAKAKGLGPLKVMFKHAFRNAIIPVISVIGLTPSLLILGIIMIEYTFFRGGLGYLLIRSVMTVGRMREPPTPLLQALFVAFATLIIALQFAVDVSLGFLNPRIRTDDAEVKVAGDRKRGTKLRKPFHTRDFQSFMRSIKSKSGRFGVNVILFFSWAGTKLRKPFHTRDFQSFMRFMKSKSGRFGVNVILFFGLVGLIFPWLRIKDPFVVDSIAMSTLRHQLPSGLHWLGTDYMGRDVLGLILWAARASLIEGLGAIALALALGCFVGLISGYYRGRWIGYLLDRVTDVFLAIPIIVIIIYFPAEADPFKWVTSVGVTMWPVTAKLVRAEVISVKEKSFIEAARAAGAGRFYIMFRCILPEVVPAVAASMLFVAVTALSVQSSIDYLGFSRFVLPGQIDYITGEPYLSWGTILASSGQTTTPAFGIKAWWVIFPPGICIAMFGLALLAVGNRIIEIVNPKLAIVTAHESTESQ